MSLRVSALDPAHRALGAKMAEFAGWEMPISYPTGTLAEHAACRENCAVFDVSHLGTVRVTGPDAFDTLQRAFTNDLGKVARGRAQYTHLLNERDASVEDDIIVWWIDDDVFDVMPNASNTSRVIEAVGGTDVTSDRVVVAVQGPRARALVSQLSESASRVGRFHVVRETILGAECTIAGTGYTGEDGVEIAIPREHSERLWDRLLEVGAVPAGLGARDTLRLEAGLPLHGHELGPGITPLQAGLGWVVAWSKPTFIGRSALEREKQTGIPKRLHGLSIEGRRPAREGAEVLHGDRAIGRVTSGNFSPSLGYCIALAFLDESLDTGTPVDIDVRGSMLRATVTTVPFVQKKA